MGGTQSLANLRCWNTRGCRTWSQAVLGAFLGRISHSAKPGSSVTLLGVGNVQPLGGTSLGQELAVGVGSHPLWVSDRIFREGTPDPSLQELPEATMLPEALA